MGGWAETSLYDGLLAILPMIIGRVEHPSATTNLLWRDQGPAEALSYRCADGGYVQLWFGAKGAYEGFLEHVGDAPSEQGYNADLVSGAMVERGTRWAAMFATARPRVLARRPRGSRLSLRAGVASRAKRCATSTCARWASRSSTTAPPCSVPRCTSTRVGEGAPTRDGGARLLDGVRVLDLSAYLAGPITPLVLAELGADVVKVEPVTGDVHRNMDPMFAAGQRGKRAVALDLKAPDAPRVLEQLFRASDVVHHNARVGLAERLGYDEATVRAANPDVVYSFASGFGETGPRALLPTNDQLMQALSGIEAGQGGAEQPPTFLVWGAVDVTSGWLSACGVLAGLYARRRHGGGQSVRSSLLGAALTLKSGAFLAGDTITSGPVLDGEQRGYGAAYRLYQGADGAWFALAVPDAASWERLRTRDGPRRAPDVAPAATDRGRRAAAGGAVARARRSPTKEAAAWVAALRSADVPVEPVAEVDRTGFISGFLDDPVNRQLGRVVTLAYGERGPARAAGVPAPARARAARRGTGGHPRPRRAHRRAARVARLRRRSTRRAGGVGRDPCPTRVTHVAGSACRHEVGRQPRVDRGRRRRSPAGWRSPSAW